MNTSPNNSRPSDAGRSGGSSPGEETLRLIVNLPVPEGLADRVKAGMRAASETGRILIWRGPLRPAAGWMNSSVARGAAAAAIVCVVAGGGWRIYSHIQPAPAAKAIVMPPPVKPAGPGFSPSGVHHVPDTLEGPVLKHPVVPVSDVNGVDKVPTQPKAGPGAPIPNKKKAPRRAAVVPRQ